MKTTYGVLTTLLIFVCSCVSAKHPFVHRWTGSRLRPKYDWETLWSQQEIESGDSSTVELDPDYDEDPLQTSWLALEEAVAKPPPR
jgi:hypothetical protein